MKTTQIAPAQLWVGPADTLQAKLIDYLQQQLCGNGGCKTCTSCMAIRQQQHHALIWMTPQKQYILKDFDPLLRTLSFARQPDDLFFCIIEKADYLTPAISNKLLKPIEEPPAGYHFIYCTDRADQLPDTIRSRCVTQNFYQGSQSYQHELHTVFAATQPQDPSTVLQQIAKCGISERESLELLDALIEHWATVYKHAQKNKSAAQERAQRMVHVLSCALERPTMPGSSKLFWKDLYLQMQM